MVDKKIIVDTIKELLEANVDKDTIYSTLRDIGIDEGDIEKNYNELTKDIKDPETEDKPVKEVKKENIKQTNSEIENKPKEDETVETKEDEIVKPKKDIQEEELKKTTETVDTINIEDTKKENDTSDKKNNSGDYEDLLKHFSELESKVIEIKAEITSLTKIMKDILEENRNILSKL